MRWPTPLTGAGRRLVSRHRPPSSAAAEYGSIPEVAGTPALGPALMSSLGLRPSLDRWLWRGSWLPGLDGGPGGARGAPPATSHQPDDHERLGGTTPRCRQRGRGRSGLSSAGAERLERLIPSGCPWLHRGSSPGCPSKWRRPDPVLEMSQRAESRPGASRAGDSANHLTEGSRIRGPVNAQARGLIIPTMRPMMSPGRDSQIRSTRSIVGAPESASSQPRGLIISIMNPMMSVGQGSHTRPTSGLNGAPESASSQFRGLIISVPGVHQWRTSPSTPFPSSPSGANGLALLRLLPDVGRCSRPPGEGLDSRQRRDRRRHTAWSQRDRANDIISTGFQSRLDSHVLSSHPSRTRRNNDEPGGLTFQRPIARTALVHGTVEEREQDGRTGDLFRESKIDDQYG